MIVETNSLTTIGVGSQRVQTEPGDTALKLPNIILPVIQLIEPTQLPNLSNIVNVSSFCIATFYSKTNVASGSQNLCLLGKGLWEIYFNWSYRQTFAAPVVFNSNSTIVRLTSPTGGVSATLASFLPVQSGSFNQSWRNKFLIRENSTTIDYAWDVTGVADFIEGNIHVNAIKLL